LEQQERSEIVQGDDDSNGTWLKCESEKRGEDALGEEAEA